MRRRSNNNEEEERCDAMRSRVPPSRRRGSGGARVGWVGIGDVPWLAGESNPPSEPEEREQTFSLRLLELVTQE